MQSTVTSFIPTSEKSHTATPPRIMISKIKKEGTIETKRYIANIRGTAFTIEISASKNNKITKNKRLNTMYLKKEYSSNFNFKE